MDVVTAAGMTAHELAHQNGEETILGCSLSIVGERATFFLCCAEDSCGPREITVEAKAVSRTKSVGRTRPMHSDGAVGSESDVVSITLTRNATTSRGGIALDPTHGIVTGGSQKP